MIQLNMHHGCLIFIINHLFVLLYYNNTWAHVHCADHTNQTHFICGDGIIYIVVINNDYNAILLKVETQKKVYL